MTHIIAKYLLNNLRASLITLAPSEPKEEVKSLEKVPKV